MTKYKTREDVMANKLMKINEMIRIFGVPANYSEHFEGEAAGIVLQGRWTPDNIESLIKDCNVGMMKLSTGALSRSFDFSDKNNIKGCDDDYVNNSTRIALLEDISRFLNDSPMQIRLAKSAASYLDNKIEEFDRSDKKYTDALQTANMISVLYKVSQRTKEGNLSELVEKYMSSVSNIVNSDGWSLYEGSSRKVLVEELASVNNRNIGEKLPSELRNRFNERIDYNERKKSAIYRMFLESVVNKKDKKTGKTVLKNDPFKMKLAMGADYMKEFTEDIEVYDFMAGNAEREDISYAIGASLNIVKLGPKNEAEALIKLRNKIRKERLMEKAYKIAKEGKFDAIYISGSIGENGERDLYLRHLYAGSELKKAGRMMSAKKAKGEEDNFSYETAMGMLSGVYSIGLETGDIPMRKKAIAMAAGYLGVERGFAMKLYFV